MDKVEYLVSIFKWRLGELNRVVRDAASAFIAGARECTGFKQLNEIALFVRWNLDHRLATVLEEILEQFDFSRLGGWFISTLVTTEVA